MTFESEMKEFDQQWAEDQERTPGLLPDGVYQGENAAQITECLIQERDGRYSWVIKFEADYTVVKDGKTITGHGSVRKFGNLDHEIGRSIAAQDARRLGFNGKLSELRKECEKGTFDDLLCEIKVETKPGTERDFTNVYINKVLGKGDAATHRSSPTDDDIPF